MSKIGKQPIIIPKEVKVTFEGQKVQVSGPNGNLSLQVRPEIKLEISADQIKVSRQSESKLSKSLHGLTRSLVANMVTGVTGGHEKILELVGVGYRSAKQGHDLVLNLGYSHPVVITPADGVQIETKDNKIIVSGADKALVGETAAKIRRVRPPEPYKGKGIKYVDEIIRRKVGKAAKAIGGGP